MEVGANGSTMCDHAGLHQPIGKDEDTSDLEVCVGKNFLSLSSLVPKFAK